MDEQLAEQVRARAGGLCEYCHLADEHSEAPFEVDHIIARQHHGKTVLSNLAWSCLRKASPIFTRPIQATGWLGQVVGGPDLVPSTRHRWPPTTC